MPSHSESLVLALASRKSAAARRLAGWRDRLAKVKAESASKGRKLALYAILTATLERQLREAQAELSEYKKAWSKTSTGSAGDIRSQSRYFKTTSALRR